MITNMCKHEKTYKEGNCVWCMDCREETSGELDRPALIRVIEEEVKAGFRCSKCEEYLGEDEEGTCGGCLV